MVGVNDMNNLSELLNSLKPMLERFGFSYFNDNLDDDFASAHYCTDFNDYVLLVSLNPHSGSRRRIIIEKHSKFRRERKIRINRLFEGIVDLSDGGFMSKLLESVIR